MDLLKRLKKPEYLYRPGQLLRRLGRPSAAPAQRRVLPTPWGLDLAVSTGDAIGRAIWQMGVYDLTVSEVLWRLAGEGETCLDIGANLGYMTGLLASRTGVRGEVHAFEPHPEIHAELAANVARWSPGERVASIRLHALGLSDHPGTATLCEPPQFEGNRGTSSLEPGPSRLQEKDAGRTFEVPIGRLDDCVPPGTSIGVAKVDVEGHELGVFQGASRILAERGIRDVVFEDNDGYPGRVSSLLEQAGFTIHRLDRGLRGPLLIAADAHASDDWLPSSFLASLDPARAAAQLRPRGWSVLRAGR